MSQQHRIGQTATTVRTVDGWTEVQYHATIVVKFSNNRVILNSGGWHTNTTKTRMNQTSNQFDLGYVVFQKNYEWFVRLPSGETVEFIDGYGFARK